ncbi:unnamed protein product [Pieris brassicae]|uniref:Uncharacterized protein n=1 Tax=Pieris brassicae TaxID=7116 RepID=A0A9P0XBY6_PIEBR|nr:unnamed protein product [Pieris brassicae]
MDDCSSESSISGVAKTRKRSFFKAPLDVDGVSASDTETEGKALKEAKEEAVEVVFERHLRSKTCRKEVGKKSVIKPSFLLDEDIESLGAVDIRQRAEIRTAKLLEFAKNPGSLTEPHSDDLQKAAKDLQEIIKCLTSRSVAEETRRLQADNKRLRTHVADLEGSLKALRREFSERSAPTFSEVNPSQDPNFMKTLINEIQGGVMRSVGAMIDAKLAGMEDRLLPASIIRPPLASSKEREQVRPVGSSVNVLPDAGPKLGPSKKKRATDNQVEAGLEGLCPTLSCSQEQDGVWTSVVAHPKRKSKIDTTAEMATVQNPHLAQNLLF